MEKIVYFDEESVTDYVQVKFGGNLETTTELLKESQKGSEGGGSAKVSAGLSKIFKALIGFEAEASLEGEVHASLQTNKLAKSILQNTILTDFIELVEQAKDKPENTIKKFEGYKISAEKNSLSYMVMITPYLTMMKDNGTVQAGDFDIAINKMDEAIKGGKGYYEFKGQKGNSTVVFRFNINAFKNNYRISDLLKMKLTLYAICVGETTLDMLDINNEFDIDTSSTTVKDNPSYEKTEGDDDTQGSSPKKLKVYDVLLAGVM